MGRPTTNEEKQKDDIKDINYHEIPEKQIYGYNLKKLKSYKKIRRNYKKQNMKSTFINDLQFLLDEYSPSDKENDLNDDLLIEILNIAEEYFIYPNNKQEREIVKREAVIELMKKYYRNDEELLNKTINNLWHKVKKSNMFKRCWARLKVFFFQK